MGKRADARQTNRPLTQFQPSRPPESAGGCVSSIDFRSSAMFTMPTVLHRLYSAAGSSVIPAVASPGRCGRFCGGRRLRRCSWRRVSEGAPQAVRQQTCAASNIDPFHLPFVHCRFRGPRRAPQMTLLSDGHTEDNPFRRHVHAQARQPRRPSSRRRDSPAKRHGGGQKFLRTACECTHRGGGVEVRM